VRCFVFREAVVDRFGSVHGGIDRICTDLNRGAVDAGTGEFLERSADGAAKSLWGEVVAFAEAGEQDAVGTDAGFTRGMQEGELLFGAVKLFAAEVVAKLAEAGGAWEAFIFEREQHNGRQFLRKNGGVDEGNFH